MIGFFISIIGRLVTYHISLNSQLYKKIKRDNLNSMILKANIWRTLLIVFIGVFIINACDKPINKSMEKMPDINPVDTLLEYYPLENIDSLNEKLVKIKLTCDKRAYDELSIAYELSGELHSFYYYSLIMANKCQYSKAYLDLYLALSEPYTGEGFDDLDIRTKRLALYYLLKAYELGDLSAIYLIQERFAEGKIPKSSIYQNLQ